MRFAANFYEKMYWTFQPNLDLPFYIEKYYIVRACK